MEKGLYIMKPNLDIKINQIIASKVIGITQPNLSKILNCKTPCRKVVAYCITKYIDENAEIEDFFEHTKKGE